MGKKKEPVVVPDVEVVAAGSEGNAITRVDNLVVFVPYVVPGDIIDLKIFRKKNNYAEGKAIAIKRPSPYRIEPACRHFGHCGGCKWQTTRYDVQLHFKQRQVQDTLERIGHVDTSDIQPICGSENTLRYRNKMDYACSTKRWLLEGEEADPAGRGAMGFHVPVVFDKVLDIEECVLQQEPTNRIRNAVREYAFEHELPFYDLREHTGFLRNVVLRCTTTGEWMAIVIVAEQRPELLVPLLEFLKERFPEITSLVYIVNTKFNDMYTDLEVVNYYGKGYITEQMPRYGGGEPLLFRINPKSFYQTNAVQAYKLYCYVAEYAALKGDETVYDLYTGTGTIAQFVAGMCRKVVGIEYVDEAIADAKENARVNGLTNCTFYAGDMAKVLTPEFVAANGRPDVVITDPPRAGMHEKVVEQLLAIGARRIVYVSCNPSTQARDIALLSQKYKVGRLQPVDMFPHTQHVENVAELTLREDAE